MNEIKANKIHYLMLYCSASPTHTRTTTTKKHKQTRKTKNEQLQKNKQKKAIKVCAFYYFKMVCV